MHRTLALVVVAIAASLVTHPARADVPVRLTWTAPDGCPTRDAVLREVSRILGEPLPSGETVTARAVVTRTSTGWQVTLRTQKGVSSGERSFGAPPASRSPTPAP